MTVITKDTIFDFADLCRRDPAFLEGFKHNLTHSGLWEMLGGSAPVVKLETAPPPAPLASEVTAIQTALFDNWPSGKPVKSTPNRYGLSVEMWNCPADDIEAVKVGKMNHVFKSNISLMPQKNLLAQIAQLRKPRANALSAPDSHYLDTLAAIAGMMGDGQSIGLLNTNIRTNDSLYHRGQYYPAFQFVMVTMEAGEVISAGLILSEDDILDPMMLPAFSSTDWEGKSLGHKVIGQSRHDRVGFAPNWSTD